MKYNRLNTFVKMSLKLSNAGPAEVLRASQKDISYIKNLQENALDAFRRLFGSRAMMMHSSCVKVLTECIYYSFLALSNSQTLGEEYTGIIKVDASFITIPHKMLQLLNIILQCVGELFVGKFISSFKKNIENNPDIQDYLKDILLKALSVITKIQPLVEQVHRGLFFTIGGYFHISKRLTSINYVLIRHWMKDYSFNRGFKLLGAVTLIHAILNCLLILSNINKTNIKSKNETKSHCQHKSLERSACKCVLCLSDICDGSALPCGHVFCWSCISDCLNCKPECPVCREPAISSQIVLLQNI